MRAELAFDVLGQRLFQIGSGAMEQAVYMAGSEQEAGHHVQPLRSRLPIRCVEPAELLKLPRPGDLVLFYSEHFDRFREVSLELENRRVARLYLLDGILEWRNAWENRVEEPACPFTMRPVLADVTACIGASQARILAAWGNFGRLEIVGVPRFDRLREHYLQSATAPSPGTGPFRLLVTTAKCPGFTPEQIAMTRRSLEDFKAACPQVLASGRKVEVTWRLTAGLAEDLGVVNHLSETTGLELSELLLQHDAVISTPSTAGLEAMLAGRPLAWLDYHRVPQWVPAAWTIAHRDEVQSVLEELAKPSARRLYWQRQLLQDHLYLGEPATERLGRLIEAMLRRSQACLSTEGPIDWRGGLLDPPVNPALSFSHADLYPSFAEFREPELVRAQTEWAHCRREIGHLQRELQQVSSELAQAHAIFDEIHRHPIAGPIVRLRERMLHHWQAFRAAEGGRTANGSTVKRGRQTP